MTQRDELTAKIADRDYVLKQYRDASNFRTRQRIWDKSGAGVRLLQHWLFDRLIMDPDAAVLELGSGPGDLWRENLDRIPSGWRVTLSDLSEGMLDEARAALSAGNGRFDFRQVDAMAIPFADRSFDAVIANLMLYHVPEPARAIAEIRRVLKPGGRLYAATFTTRVIAEDGQPRPPARGASEHFNLENGAEQLARCFEHVEVERKQPPLLLTDPELIARMYLSVVSGLPQSEAFSEEEALKRIMPHFKAHPITIRMEYGLFIAS